ncbi:MAG: recombinase family protein, partial [Thermoanaerobaculia bacterium]
GGGAPAAGGGALRMSSRRGIGYARVSSGAQVPGASLDQQAEAFVSWFQRSAVDLARTFVEAGESAKTRDRKQLRTAFDFIRSERRAGRQIDLFVVYDLTRFCRNLDDQRALQRELCALGVELQAVTLPIVDNAQGRGVTNILGSVNQMVNEFQGEKISECMQHRVRQGRWPFPAPMGYRNRHDEAGTRKWVEPDPVMAPLVTMAFEAVARGERMVDVLARVTALGLRSKHGAKIRRQEFRKMFDNPFYAGRVVSKKHGIEAAGEHEAIVTAEAFALARRALAGNVAAPRRSGIEAEVEFPLRGLVRCESCGKPLVADRARGKMGRLYAYYRCWLPGCRAVRAGAALLERAFVVELEHLQLDGLDFDMVSAALRDEWAEFDSKAAEIRSRLSRQVMDLRAKRDRWIEAYVHEKAMDRETYERTLQRLDREQGEIYFQLAQAKTEGATVDDLLTFAKPLLTAPAELWRRANLDQKRRIQSLIFPAGMAVGKKALPTPQTASIFSELRGDNVGKVKMVERSRATSNRIRTIFQDAAALVREVFGAQAVPLAGLA